MVMTLPIVRLIILVLMKATTWILAYLGLPIMENGGE